MEITEELVKDIGKVQAQILVLTYLVQKQPFGYSGNNLGEFERDMSRRGQLEKAQQKFGEYVSTISTEEVSNFVKKNPNARLLEAEQREVIYEITGKKETVEEFIKRVNL